MSNGPDRADPRAPGAMVANETDIVAFALAAAVRCGDPDPELVQHVVATREAATKTTGSWVLHDQTLSYFIAVKGRFSAPRRVPPSAVRLPPRHRPDETMAFSVLVRVVDIQTGRVTDSGGTNDYPNLASLGPVVTDYRSAGGRAGHDR